jgi:hypothetical protein
MGKEHCFTRTIGSSRASGFTEGRQKKGNPLPQAHTNTFVPEALRFQMLGTLHRGTNERSQPPAPQCSWVVTFTGDISHLLEAPKNHRDIVPEVPPLSSADDQGPEEAGDQLSVPSCSQGRGYRIGQGQGLSLPLALTRPRVPALHCDGSSG